MNPREMFIVDPKMDHLSFEVELAPGILENHTIEEFTQTSHICLH